MSESQEFRETFNQYLVTGDEPTEDRFSEYDKYQLTKNSYALPNRPMRKSVLMKKFVDRADIDEQRSQKITMFVGSLDNEVIKSQNRRDMLKKSKSPARTGRSLEVGPKRKNYNEHRLLGNKNYNEDLVQVTDFITPRKRALSPLELR